MSVRTLSTAVIVCFAQACLLDTGARPVSAIDGTKPAGCSNLPNKYQLQWRNGTTEIVSTMGKWLVQTPTLDGVSAALPSEQSCHARLYLNQIASIVEGFDKKLALAAYQEVTSSQDIARSPKHTLSEEDATQVKIAQLRISSLLDSGNAVGTVALPSKSQEKSPEAKWQEEFELNKAADAEKEKLSAFVKDYVRVGGKINVQQNGEHRCENMLGQPHECNGAPGIHYVDSPMFYIEGDVEVENRSDKPIRVSIGFGFHMPVSGSLEMRRCERSVVLEPKSKKKIHCQRSADMAARNVAGPAVRVCEIDGKELSAYHKKWPGPNVSRFHAYSIGGRIYVRDVDDGC